ncbi:hypothetical protein CEXT_460501 [Caerostris extrusa]|uniref:Uncharacterized protein n=1 Tax=Caerostris extrusa TaxID=172846 RepID=A0AAV4NLG3_CAEEX|nr:hypothetical protein CEXT_460501 [Caerostris extrusa]
MFIPQKKQNPRGRNHTYSRYRFFGRRKKGQWDVNQLLSRSEFEIQSHCNFGLNANRLKHLLTNREWESISSHGAPMETGGRFLPRVLGISFRDSSWNRRVLACLFLRLHL